jgi:hypothetical protein
MLAKSSDTGGGGVRFVEQRGSALLLTDNCILDKRTSRRGEIRIGRLHFAPVRALGDLTLDPDSLRRLRGNELNPPEPIFLNLGDDGEFIALIGETFSIPAPYFELEGTTDESDPTDNHRVKIGRTDHDTRIWAMETHEHRLLQEKLAYFWSHAELSPVCAVCWQDCELSEGEWHHQNDGGHIVQLTDSKAALERNRLRAAETERTQSS